MQPRPPPVRPRMVADLVFEVAAAAGKQMIAGIASPLVGLRKPAR